MGVLIPRQGKASVRSFRIFAWRSFFFFFSLARGGGGGCCCWYSMKALVGSSILKYSSRQVLRTPYHMRHLCFEYYCKPLGVNIPVYCHFARLSRTQDSRFGCQPWSEMVSHGQPRKRPQVYEVPRTCSTVSLPDIDLYILAIGAGASNICRLGDPSVKNEGRDASETVAEGSPELRVMVNAT